jgi:hypothetical protein
VLVADDGHRVRYKANDDPGQQDQMVDEFRALILGH